MGWIGDVIGHEGYIVGLVVDKEHSLTRDCCWRELGYPIDTAHHVELKAIVCACDCGWRSQRVRAPMDTTYSPYIVCATERTEETMHALWKEHMQTAGPITSDLESFYDLQKRLITRGKVSP